MAVTLSASLAAHQKKLAGRKPVLTVTASAKRAQLELLRWTRYYTGAEADSPSAVQVADDGSLVRARINGTTVQTSRVTSPGSGSTYSSWTNMGAPNDAWVAAGASIAMARNPATNELALAWTRSNRQGVYVALSTNNGATWSTPTIRLSNAPSSGYGCALAYRANGDIVLFMVKSDLNVYYVRRTGGAWGGTAGTVWTNAAMFGTPSIAATHDGADVMLAIGDRITSGSGPYTLRSCLFGDGGLFASGVWSSVVTVAAFDAAGSQASVSSGLALVGSYPRLLFNERNPNAVAVNYGREVHPVYAEGALGKWTAPEPFEGSNLYAPSLCWRSNAAWAVTPAGVWHADTGQTDDLSTRVLACKYRIGSPSARLQLELDNHDGALNGAPNGTFDGLMVGGTLTVQPGYYSGTADAAEYGVTVDFLIDRITYRHPNDGQLVAIVEGSGPWEAAQRTEVGQVFQFAAAGTLRSVIFRHIAGRAGFAVAEQGAPRAPSAAWSGDSPAFATSPGKSVAAALSRLLSPVSDGLRLDRQEVRVVGNTTSDASDATYGTAGNHPVLSLDLADQPPDANWLRLSGDARWREDAGFASVYQHGARLRQLRNMGASSDALANSFAPGALRHDTIEREYGELVAPFDAGRQVLDIITLTDTALGISAVTYRVLAVALDYARGPKSARYNSILTLGGM